VLAFAILPIIEIISHTGDVFDYAAKYTKGLSEHIIPARLDNDVAQRVNEIAKQSYTLLGCKGFARVDFIIENEQLPYVLEINTIPGMTETSLLPEAANSSGISFTELIQSIIEYALEE
jgi:D-alanine-D-alanine ligase